MAAGFVSSTTSFPLSLRTIRDPLTDVRPAQPQCLARPATRHLHQADQERVAQCRQALAPTNAPRAGPLTPVVRGRLAASRNTLETMLIALIRVGAPTTPGNCPYPPRSQPPRSLPPRLARQTWIEDAELPAALNQGALGARATREARSETRTRDPFLTMEVLYQLSYPGAADNFSDAWLNPTPSNPEAKDNLIELDLELSR
jgi:hypothetical protein